MAIRKTYQPKPIKLDLTPASPVERARILEGARRFTVIIAAKKFASDVHANPSMRFEDLERRVRELSLCLTVGSEGSIASATGATASAMGNPFGGGRTPGGRKPKSAYAEAYAIRDQTGSWKKVWQSMRDKFPTPESRTKVREAYKTRNRRRKGTKPASSR